MRTVKQILNDGNVDELLPLFGFDFDTITVEKLVFKFNLWARYCFPQFYQSADAPFHKEIDENNAKVLLGKIKTYTDLAYRGAAKTTRTKLFFAYFIANDRLHRRRYFKILSEDGGNSTQSVTDIYNLLIEPVVRTLYPEIFQKTEAKREETMSSFTTATEVKLLADTVGSSQRGQIQDESRPDVVWFDDFETRKTLRSAVMTKAIWDNMEEAKDGLSLDGGAIYTANYLSERGNVQKLVEKEDAMNLVTNVALVDDDGEPTWPSRYTRESAAQILKDASDPEGEYLGKPSASRDILFDRQTVAEMPTRTPIKIVADQKIFFEYNPSHRYALGADISGGVGLDSSTAIIIDFDTIPARVVATYKTNTTKPDIFGDELARQGTRFGECLIAPEKNNHGHATIGRLKQIYPIDKIYQTERPEDRVKQRIEISSAEFGWETNALTKPKMLFALAKAIENGWLTIPDPDVKAELKAYTRNDLMDREVDPRLTTRHFDFLTAVAITWQMKDSPLLSIQKVEPPRQREKPKALLEFESPLGDNTFRGMDGEHNDMPFDE